MRDRGFTLVEVVVALLLLSVTAIAMIESLLGAQRMQRTSGSWMAATMLAQDSLERLRAGEAAPPHTIGPYQLSPARSAFDEDLGLDRIEVTVQWNDAAGPVELRIASLVGR